MALSAFGTATRWIVLTAIVALGFAVTFALRPIPQPAWYHDFADNRTLLGVPNVAVYDGSLLEWSADPTLPMETT